MKLFKELAGLGLSIILLVGSILFLSYAVSATQVEHPISVIAN